MDDTTMNPMDIERYFEGLEYPASKQDLVSQAEVNGAEGDVLETIKKMSDKEYESPLDVRDELERIV